MVAFNKVRCTVITVSEFQRGGMTRGAIAREVRSIAGGKAGSVDRTGLAEFNPTRIHFSRMFAGALDAGGDTGQRFKSGGSDRLAAEAAPLDRFR